MRRQPKTLAPSRAEAADLLHQLARYVEHPGIFSSLTDAERERWRLRLELIADCIEETLHWRKGAALTIEQQNLIRAVADMADRRPRGENISQALDRLAGDVAMQWGKFGPNETEWIRGLIVDARKAPQGK